MHKQSIAIFFCVLIMTLPLSLAQENIISEFDEQDTGESVIINVKSYEPAVLKSNLLEDGEVEVYAYLQGVTPGSLLSGVAKFGQQKDEPFFATPNIKQVKIKPLDTESEKAIQSLKYITPLKYSLENLGIESIRLKQIPTEKEMPEEIVLNLNAEVTFDNAERLFSLIQQDLVLPQDVDEEAWKAKTQEEYAAFSGRVFIRASDIQDNEASFVIYETKGYKEQSSGILSSIEIALKGFVQTRSKTLKVGETSSPIKFSQLGFVPGNAFRIKLNRISDPQKIKARIRVSVDGKTQDLVVYENMPLFSGSSYKIKSINQRILKTGQKIDEITIQGPKGQLTATKEYNSMSGKTISISTYGGTNKVINPFKIINLKDNLKTYFPKVKVLSPGAGLSTNLPNTIGTTEISIEGIKFDYPSSVALPTDLTNEFEIKKDMTLGQVLVGILPSRYSFTETKDGIEIRATKEVEAGRDVCEGRVTLLRSEDDVRNSPAENVACTAINEYKELADKYGSETSERGVLYRDEANYKIGKLYYALYNILPPENQVMAAENALQYLKKSVASPKIVSDTDAIEILNELQKNIEQNSQQKPIIFQDNGREITVTVKEVISTPLSLMPQATIEIDGRSRQYKTGDNLLPNKDYTWRVRQINQGSVQLERVALGTIRVNAGTETLNLKSPKTIDGLSAVLQDVQLHKEAYISLVPGQGKPLISNSNFTIHIPIEKRAIQLSPETIDQQMNQTQYWIGELDKIINQMQSVVKTWNTVCLATFAYLTIKNSFFLGFSRSQVRSDVVYGPDRKSGWSVYCTENSGKGRKYVNYDECIRENEDKIETQIDETQTILDKLDGEMKDYKNQQWYKDLMSKYQQIDKYGKYIGEEEFFTLGELRQYRYDMLLKETSSYTTLIGQENQYNLRKEVDSRSLDLSGANTKRLDAYNSAVDAISKKYTGLSPEKEQEAFNDVYRLKLQESQKGIVSSEEFRMLNEKTVKIIPLMRKLKDGPAYINKPEGKIALQQATVTDYVATLTKLAYSSQDQKEITNFQNEILRMQEKYGKLKNLGAPLSTSQGAVYVDNDGLLYTSLANYDLSQINTEYKIKNVEIYPDGKPHCVPTSKGNYVKVLDFFEDGSPKTVQEWNVGTDGALCTNDDIPLKHETVLNLPENDAVQRDLRNKAARIGKHQNGEIVAIGGNEFIVSSAASKANNLQTGSSCYDVMDPDDCTTLFGVCDPVMCPPSRFNLGGAYQVDDVVQSGIIGSLVLGLNNFNAKEPVPICLTGVLAGLQNIRSVLQGYVQCLKEAQTTGKSVGICDQIRSVYICDIVYREAASLFNAKGGMINWIAKKLFGEGGGEYLNFQNSLQNTQKSVSFFTQQYAKTAFASYRGRSTEEIGKTICNVAIYGKLPQIGEVVDQLTAPESPPQFLAKLAVSPHIESAQIRKEAYNIFYHIYAGENKKAQYSVFLRNRVGDTYYASEKCGKNSAEIEKGGISSQSLDCIADAGFDEVCVTINGVTQCGFGKVTSTFSLNYLNDLIVEDEASKQITKEEDCVPDNQRYSTPLYNAIPGSSFASTGVVRVCSVQNPGQGTNPASWKIIGTCGKDAADRSIGSCWIDMRTITIKDTDRMEKTKRSLQEAGLNQTKMLRGATELMDKETSQTELARLKKEPKNTLSQMMGLAQSYASLEDNTLSLEVAAESRYQKAQLYELMRGEVEPPIPDFLAVPVEEAPKIPETITPQNTKIIEASCEQCEADILGWCPLSDCHELSESCVSTLKRVVSPEGISMFAGVWNSAINRDDRECHACSNAKACSFFNEDKTQCERTECTSQSKLECAWKAYSADSGNCVPKSEVESKTPVLGKIITIPKNIDDVRCVATDCRTETALLTKLVDAANLLKSGEQLVIASAYRSPQIQMDLYKKYLSGEKTEKVCGPTKRTSETTEQFQKRLDDINEYNICPHVKGAALDLYLCDSTKTGTRNPQDTVCPKYKAGYENSKRLQEVMCAAEFAGYAPERWHYEYASLDWNQLKKEDPGQCIFGREKDNRESYQVVSPV